jgi:hypothetical protein
MAQAKPVFQGSAENHFAIGNLHSSQGGIEDVVNSAALMSRKRTPEKQSDYHQPVSPGLSTHWTDYDFSAGGDFLGERNRLSNGFQRLDFHAFLSPDLF